MSRSRLGPCVTMPSIDPGTISRHVADEQTPLPFVSPTESPAEATLKGMTAGILFGILFGAANAYLGLRAGLTIPTSIPVAVMTVALFRALRAGGVQRAHSHAKGHRVRSVPVSCWAKYACASPRKCCSGSDSRSYAYPTRGASSSASRGRLGRIA